MGNHRTASCHSDPLKPVVNSKVINYSREALSTYNEHVRGNWVPLSKACGWHNPTRNLPVDLKGAGNRSDTVHNKIHPFSIESHFGKDAFQVQAFNYIVSFAHI